MRRRGHDGRIRNRPLLAEAGNMRMPGFQEQNRRLCSSLHDAPASPVDRYSRQAALPAQSAAKPPSCPHCADLLPFERRNERQERPCCTAVGAMGALQQRAQKASIVGPMTARKIAAELGRVLSRAVFVSAGGMGRSAMLAVGIDRANVIGASPPLDPASAVRPPGQRFRTRAMGIIQRSRRLRLTQPLKAFYDPRFASGTRDFDIADQRRASKAAQ